MDNKRFSTIKEEVMDKWHEAVKIEGLPKEAFKPEIKIVKDKSGKSAYTFGIILNEHRFRRLGALEGNEGSNDCNLCNAVNLSKLEKGRNLFPDLKLEDFVVLANKFPIMEGFSMAITYKERPMYTTRNLDGVSKELEEWLDFTDKTGFELFHNSPGFGATIPKHEHWHLTSFRK